jgi:hypothetical protein
MMYRKQHQISVAASLQRVVLLSVCVFRFLVHLQAKWGLTVSP